MATCLKAKYCNSCNTTTDVDECNLDDIAPCADTATCSNEIGGFTCVCKDGFEGNGLDCVGMQYLFLLLH